MLRLVDRISIILLCLWCLFFIDFILGLILFYDFEAYVGYVERTMWQFVKEGDQKNYFLSKILGWLLIAPYYNFFLLVHFLNPAVAFFLIAPEDLPLVEQFRESAISEENPFSSNWEMFIGVLKLLKRLIRDAIKGRGPGPGTDAVISLPELPLEVVVPTTSVAEAIIDFHHDLMFFLIVILGLVFWLLFRAIALHLLSVNEKYFIKFFDTKQQQDGIISFSRSDYKFRFTNNILSTFIVPFRRAHQPNLEIILTVLPTIILILIAIPSFALLYSMDELVDPQYTLRVVGHQWYWSYEVVFSTDEFSDTLLFMKKFDSNMKLTEDLDFGELRLLEVNKKVFVPYRTVGRILVTSQDVLHSWSVPSFGIKIDACPGRLNQVPLFPKRIGTYYGQCSEICGVNHGFMPIVVKVVQFDDFKNWFLAHHFFIDLRQR